MIYVEKFAKLDDAFEASRTRREPLVALVGDRVIRCFPSGAYIPILRPDRLLPYWLIKPKPKDIKISRDWTQNQEPKQVKKEI